MRDTYTFINYDPGFGLELFLRVKREREKVKHLLARLKQHQN